MQNGWTAGDDVLMQADQMMLGNEQPSALMSDQFRSQYNDTEERAPQKPSKFHVVSLKPKKLSKKQSNQK